MPEQASADFEQVMAQCSRGCFTGFLRVRTREGNGEVRFLSGIQDGIRFDTMEGDAALERLQTASEPEFEAISALPPIDVGSTEPVPPEGRLSRFHAAQLMRYCESNSLTCALELEVEGTVLTARYRLGELLSVEPDSEHTARLAEAKEGLYRFRLPRFELPANVQQRRSVPAAAPKAAPSAAPAAAPSKPAPAAPTKAPATPLAETPLVGLRPVAVGGAPASAKAAAPAAAKAPAPAAARAPATPAATPARSPSPSASPAARPAADVRPQPSPAQASPGRAAAASSPPAPVSPFRREEPAKAPAASPGARSADARTAAALAPTPAMPSVQSRPAAASPSAAPAARAPSAAPAARAPSAAPAARPPSPAPARPSSVPAGRPAVPRSPIPQAPAAAAASAGAPSTPPATPKSAPLGDGLWADAVKPPPQSSPLELDLAVRAAAAGNAAQAAKNVGRAEGLSSLAYKPAPDEAAVSSRRQRASARYWLVALVLLLAVAALGWFVFGR